MRSLLLMSTLLTAAALGAAAKSKPYEPGRTPKDRAAVDADGVLRRGNIQSREETLSIGECAEKASELDGKTVRLDGWVAAACTNKGCWFTLTGDEAGPEVRIRFEDYKYFVPKDIPGKRALVEGRLEVKKLSRREAQHYEDDRARSAGDKAKKIASGRTELTVFATGVEIRPKAVD